MVWWEEHPVWVWPCRANGTLRVNKTLVPCPRNGGGGFVKEEELLDDLF